MIEEVNEIELRRIDLNLLLVLSALIRAGSVQGAAEQLLLGPSAVSMALGRLRKLMGDPLFIRGPGGMVPTDRARDLYVRLSPALVAIADTLRSGTAFEPVSAATTFRIGLSDDLEWTLLPGLTGALLRASPGAKIVARATNYLAAPDQLDYGEIDLAVTAHPHSTSARHLADVVYVEDFTVIGARGTMPPDWDARRFASCSHGMVSSSGRDWGVIDDALAKQNLRRRVVATVDRFTALPFVLRDSTLIATLPRRPAERMARVFGLDLRELPFASPKFQVGLSWHRRSDLSPSHRWFRELVKTSLMEGAETSGKG